MLVGSGHTEQLPAAHHPLRTPVKATCAGGDPSGMSLLSLGGFSCWCLQSSWRQQVPLILPWCCCCFVFAVPLVVWPAQLQPSRVWPRRICPRRICHLGCKFLCAESTSQPEREQNCRSVRKVIFSSGCCDSFLS